MKFRKVYKLTLNATLSKTNVGIKICFLQIFCFYLKKKNMHSTKYFKEIVKFLSFNQNWLKCNNQSARNQNWPVKPRFAPITGQI